MTDTTITETPWTWWARKLAGEKMGASEGTPHAGFYRWIRKNAYGGLKWAEPVAYWPLNEEELNCRIGDQDVSPQRGRDIWINVCNSPVDEQWYREVTEADPPQPEWRDGIPLQPTIGDNEPPEGVLKFEVLRDRIELKAKEAAKRLDGPPIANAAEASKIAIMADELAALWKEADEQRKTERKPHDNALKSIQVMWAPLLLQAETYRNLKFKLLTPWANKLEAERRGIIESAIAAGEEIPESAKKRAKITTRGRAMSLKPTRRAEIENYAECLKFFSESADMKAFVQDLANKAVRAGVTVPGCKLIEESQVV